jgi:glucokinase
MVLGGGMVEAMPDIFLEEVSRAAREHVMPAFENTFKVVVAGLGDDATALGAAAWAERVVLGAAERKS